jgi:hypothetical protein
MHVEQPGVDESRLRTLLRVAIKEVDKVFDFTIADKQVDNDPEVEFLDHLAGLDLAGEVLTSERERKKER